MDEKYETSVEPVFKTQLIHLEVTFPPASL